MKTSELAAYVRKHSLNFVHGAVDELERRASVQAGPLEERVARLEEKSFAADCGKTVRPSFTVDLGLYKSAFKLTLPGLEQFKRELGPLAAKHGVHVDVTRIEVANHAGKQPGFNFVPEARDPGSYSHKVHDNGKCEHEHLAKIASINGFDIVPRLAPAESCSEAVARFRDALELLAKRHAVEVEIGGTSPGASCAGITDLPEDDEDCTAERERVALDAIEAWQEQAPSDGHRSAEIRKRKYPPLPRCRYSIVLDERRTGFKPCDGSRTYSNTSKEFRGLSRLAALEAAAIWCAGQK